MSPTRREITQRSRAIQATWSEPERLRRLANDHIQRRVPYEIPTINLSMSYDPFEDEFKDVE